MYIDFGRLGYYKLLNRFGIPKLHNVFPVLDFKGVNHFFCGIAIHMVLNQRLIITRVILNIEMLIAQHPRQ